jgi:hypothetical protein
MSYYCISIDNCLISHVFNLYDVSGVASTGIICLLPRIMLNLIP